MQATHSVLLSSSCCGGSIQVNNRGGAWDERGERGAEKGEVRRGEVKETGGRGKREEGRG